MSNGFGFLTPGSRPAPDPKQVGAMLMQGPQMGQGQQQQPMMPPDDRVAHEAPAHTRDEALRREGGKLMGGGGSDEDGALSAAVGEALTRAGGGHTPNPNPHKNRSRHVRQLQQLGISEVEATLLGETL